MVARLLNLLMITNRDNDAVKELGLKIDIVDYHQKKEITNKHVVDANQRKLLNGDLENIESEIMQVKKDKQFK